MVKNIYNVDEDRWASWSKKSRKMFNHLYDTMAGNQDLYSHPKAAQQIDEYWDTTAWNAAWTAADCINRSK